MPLNIMLGGGAILLIVVISSVVTWKYLVDLRIALIVDKYKQAHSWIRGDLQKEIGQWQRSYLLAIDKIEPDSARFKELNAALRYCERLAIYSTGTVEVYLYRRALERLGSPLLGKRGVAAAQELCLSRLNEIKRYVAAVESAGLMQAFDQEFPGTLEQVCSAEDVARRFKVASSRRPNRIMNAGTLDTN